MALKAVKNISDAPYNNAYVFDLRPSAEVLVDDHWAGYLVSTGRFEALSADRVQELAELGFTQEWEVFYQEAEPVVPVDERVTELKSTINDELINEPEPGEPEAVEEAVAEEETEVVEEAAEVEAEAETEVEESVDPVEAAKAEIETETETE